MTISAIVSGYNEVSSLKKIMPSVLRGNFDEIIMSVGGEDGTYEYVNSLKDKRVQVVFEESRMGKMPALRSAIKLLSGEITFLICGDTDFDSSNIWKAIEYMDPDVGVVVPRVVPINVTSFPARVASLIWSLRNSHLLELDRRRRPLHGGELVVAKTSILRDLRDVVNDDAFICLRAIELGFRVRYAAGITISNRVPETFRNILAQRKRVNFGHQQLSDYDMKPAVLNNTIFTDAVLFLTVIYRVIRHNRNAIFYLPFAVILEMLAMFLSKRDRKKKVDMIIWPLVG